MTQRHNDTVIKTKRKKKKKKKRKPEVERKTNKKE